MSRLGETALAAAVAIGMLAVGRSCGVSAAPAPWGQSGDDIEHPASVDLAMGPNGYRCTAAPMPSGWYFAAHCLGMGAPRLPDGRLRPWSSDGARDLAHIADRGSPAGITIGAAIPGDALTWRNSRGWGAVRVVGERTFRHWPWTDDALATVCHIAGLPFRRGDSGTGLHRAADGAGGEEGALVGIFVGDELDTVPNTVEYLADYDRHCGAGQMAFYQVVP